ncbi:MAG TPA: hypothetical protein VLH60_07970, partial [Sedimentisphaerales bacterium]|nr:hypothetical protein [Sedimentisphaerales bacterium]
MLVGGLAVVFVVAVLWSTGLLSGGNAQTPAASATPEAPAPTFATINWQRPSLPLSSRDPMTLGVPGTMPASSQEPGSPGKAPSLNVMGVYHSGDVAIALIDGVNVRVGETHRGATIVAITNDYVEYEIGGTTTREYLGERQASEQTETGSEDIKP